MTHEVIRNRWHNGLFYSCNKCSKESPYELIGECMGIRFQDLSDDELKALEAQWYLKYRQSLDYFSELRRERERRAEQRDRQLFFTEWGVVISPKGEGGE